MNIKFQVFCCFSIFVLFAGNVRADLLSTSFEIPRTITHTIDSKVLGRSYDIYVKLPLGYDKKKNAQQSYPVIYLNDGPYTFQVASGVTRLPIAAKKMTPVILVGISFAKGEKPRLSRTLDLTPVVDKQWKGKTGGGLNYLSFIETEVIPLIEKTYRADSSQRTLSGQSFGGSFGVLALFSKPQLFKNYVLTSPSIWFGHPYLFELEEQFAKENTDLNANIYFATGQFEQKQYGKYNDMVTQQNELVAKLRSRKYSNLNIRAEIIEGAHHETTFPIAFTKGIQWLYGLYDDY